jgi:hypothetical protein
VSSFVGSIALAFLVFGGSGNGLGVWDDGLFLLTAGVFLYCFVRLIRARVASAFRGDGVDSDGRVD